MRNKISYLNVSLRSAGEAVNYKGYNIVQGQMFREGAPRSCHLILEINLQNIIAIQVSMRTQAAETRCINANSSRIFPEFCSTIKANVRQLNNICDLIIEQNETRLVIEEWLNKGRGSSCGSTRFPFIWTNRIKWIDCSWPCWTTLDIALTQVVHV